ncbi:MAG: aspartate/glutamate racemase family protein [Holophagales bacterium]|nr:aspartate/glutamate racemase family protein [Holophagales bacterium]MYC08755.1 aspartate/glutamate racemase family protein [Holophagales bacterium]
MRQRRLIGIVGGLGPFAHIDFERKLLDAASELIGARRDQDFPQWVLSSIPQTPDRTEAFFGEADDPTPVLQRSLERVQGAGADFAVVACNTAHLFLERLRDESPLPIISLIEVTADEAARIAPGGSVGVLATSGTLRSRLYHDPLEARGLRAVSPFDLEDGEELQRRTVMEPIYGPWVDGRHQGGGIKTDGGSEEARALLEGAAGRLVADGGADVLVAGCTEIPLALGGAEVAGRPLLDPARLLAKAAVRYAYGL